MTPEQAERAIEAAESKSGAAQDACEAWCNAEVKSFVVPLPPWGEAEEPPDSDGHPVDQYRFWLWETESADSAEKRKEFGEVLHGWELDKWEEGKQVEWN